MSGKRNGDNWEQDLISQNWIIENKGLARVRKLPDPVRITGRDGGKITGYPTRREWADFYGVLKGGNAIAFEAKSTTEEASFPLASLRAKKDGDPSQLEILQAIVELGGIAFVALRHTPDYAFSHEDFLLPVAGDGRLAGYDVKDRASLPIDELGPYKIKPGETWLDTLIRLKKEGRLK